MNYISVKEAAEKWSVSERMVTKYCVQGVWHLVHTRECSQAHPKEKGSLSASQTS